MSIRNKDYKSTQSEVANEAQHHEAAIRVTVGRSDQQMTEQGFELDEMMNKDGISLQKTLLYPGDKKMPLLTEERLAEMKNEKLRPHDAVQDALRHNPYASRYDQWRLHAPRWLRRLDAYMRDYMNGHSSFREAQQLSPDILNHIAKPVVSIGTQADVTYQADLFFIFHNPLDFELARKGFAKPEGREGSEALYWNSENDTIVTIDICGDINTKLKQHEQEGHMPRADIIASKIGMMANPDLLQTLHPGGFGQYYWVQNYEQRLRRLAKLIVDTYLIKRAHRIHNLRNPEKERSEREHGMEQREQEREQRLGQERKATKSHATDVLKSQKQSKKDEKRREQARAAKEKKEQLKQAGKQLRDRK